MYNFTHFRSVLLRKVKASSLEYLSLSGADCFVLHMLSDNLPPPLDGPVPYRDVQENRHEKWLGSHGQPQPKPAQINHRSIKANQCKKPSFSDSLQMTTLKLVFACEMITIPQWSMLWISTQKFQDKFWCSTQAFHHYFVVSRQQGATS